MRKYPKRMKVSDRLLRRLSDSLGVDANMEQSLQILSANQRLAEWSERVASCRNSGMGVRKWCEEHGVQEKTYYYWQRKVFNTITEQQAPYFVEVPVERRQHHSQVSVTVRIGNAEADIYSGADQTTMEAVLRLLKSC